MVRMHQKEGGKKERKKRKKDRRKEGKKEALSRPQKIAKGCFFQPDMTKLNSKLFNACTKRHKETQLEHSIHHNRGHGFRNTSIVTLPTQCFTLRTSRQFRLNVTTGWGFSQTGLSPAFPWGHTAKVTLRLLSTLTMVTLGSPQPVFRGAVAGDAVQRGALGAGVGRQSQPGHGAAGQGASREKPSPSGAGARGACWGCP